MTALAGFVAYDRESRVVCAVWRGSTAWPFDARDEWLRWVKGHLDHGCAISNVLTSEPLPTAGERWVEPADREGVS